jgi:hypothetical protein
LSKWVVIDGAITDNLTELIAPDGLPWLALLAIVFSTHAAWASRASTPSRLLSAAGLAPIAVPLGWWLLLQGLEQVIVKYDVVWSAQQFLLGHNRKLQLSEGQLFTRWAMLYVGLLGLCSFGMSLARRVGSASSRITVPQGEPRASLHANQGDFAGTRVQSSGRRTP